MNKLTVLDLNLKGKRCFVRVDFNVPFGSNGEITDESRIRGAIPTISYLINEGAKVILASHLGRPKAGKRDAESSLQRVLKSVSSLLGREIEFVDDCIGEKVRNKVNSMQNGDVILLENVRYYKEETDNDEGFSKELASLADVFINDAFGAAHRAHASTAGIASFVKESAAGLLMKKEIDYFNMSVANPARPLVGILGGAKASGKIGVLRNLCEKLDKVIVSGGLAFTFMKAKGIPVGKSLVDDSLIGEAREIMAKMDRLNVKYYFPVDFIIAQKLEEGAPSKLVKEIPDDWMALDVGPESSALFEEAVADAKTIIWNGPMGAFEIDAFSSGTYKLVEAVTKTSALTIVGGGDTDYAIHKVGAEDKISYISTGGGAFLELLEGKVLPGLDVLNDKP